MKKVLSSIIALLCTVSLWAVPAYPGWQTKTQPDGTTIEIRQVGDEFYHYMINRDGKEVREVNGMYVEVGEAPTPEVAKALRAKVAARRQRKVVGTKPNLAPKGVIILANFADSKMESSHTQAVFNELCNAENCTVNKYNGVNYGSAAQYFADQSNGSYRPVFDVFGPVTLSQNTAYYGGNFEYTYQGKNYSEDSLATDAVIEACILASQQYSSLNFADYDSDNDGDVDFVYVIYAGKGEADPGSTKLPNTIWPHNYSIQEVIEGAGTYFNVFTHYKKADTKIDGKYLDNYACSAELEGSGSMSGIGTLCHEFGHVMGLPDLYDTNYGTNYKNGVTPGDWNIMDGGSYNGGGHCPPNYDPWEKYFFGWVTPENLGTAGQDITLYANGTNDYQSYQINSANTLQAVTKEGVNYYIENRLKSGWDSFIPVSGMLVWKVDFDASVWKNNAPNNTAGSPRYTIVPADGKTSKYGASGDTYPTGSIRSYTPISGHEITDITKSGNNITFKYNGGEVDYWTYELTGTNCTVPDDGQVDKGEALNLTITPDEGYTLENSTCWGVMMGDDELEYGTGFTYNASTNTFSIAEVTGNVIIIVEAQEVPVTITWMDKGIEFTTTQTSAGKLVLPKNEPDACEGKVFYGWTATANYSSEDTAPTIVKAGDDATATTYYAVFATKGEGGSGNYEKVTSAPTDWSGNYLIVNETAGVAFNGLSSSGATDEVTIKQGVITYSDDLAADEVIIASMTGGYSLQMNSSATNNAGKYLSGTSGSNAMNFGDAAVLNTLSISSGNVSITSNTSVLRYNNSTNSGDLFRYYKSSSYSSQQPIQLYRKAGGTSYSDYTTSCVPPTKYAITINDAENGSLETNPADEAAAGKKVTITALPSEHYHLATLSVKDAEDGVVEVSGTGNTRTFTMPEKAVTISASFAEDDKYTVRFFNNGVEISSEQYYAGETAEKPADPTPACEDYTFVGWWTAELAKDNTATKTWITDFTINEAKDFYAIYTHTVADEGASIVSIEASDFSSVGSGSEIGTKTVKGITFKGAQGSHQSNAPSYYSGNPNTLRCYVGNKLTISAENAISQIDFNYDGSYSGGSIARSTGSWASTPTEGWLQTWTGEATSIQFTINGSGQWRITELQVSIGGGSTTYYTSTVSCGATAVEETNANANAVKVLYNGQIFILRDGRTYTLTGNLVK